MQYKTTHLWDGRNKNYLCYSLIERDDIRGPPFMMSALKGGTAKVDKIRVTQ